MSFANFEEYVLAEPVFAEVEAQYNRLAAALDEATDATAAARVVQDWDALRRRLNSWVALTYIRFQQDTKNPQFKQAKDACAELEPKLTRLAVDMKRRLMASPHRQALEQRFGPQSFALWACDVASFEPTIEAELERQSKLDSQYAELLASPTFEFMGEKLTLSQMTKFNEHHDRQVRHEAARRYWGWFSKNRDQIDQIFADLVTARQEVARKLGQPNYIPVGYQRMQRIDYQQAEVERFRAQVRQSVVPLAAEIRRRQAKALGVDPLMAWDEAVHDSIGNPHPRGDHDWMVERAREMFAQLGAGMDEFYDQMQSRNLMDLKSRDGKAGGGFCEIVPDFRMPFIYANFQGTKADVEVFTHEMGHAFQCYASLDKPLVDYFFPTTESCEIHSMGLEFLTWPQMELFFGDDAERFRRVHLTDSIMFLPYGVAVDHFQHLIYAEPNATPDERARMWQEMERTYLPWRRWGDLAHPASGRRWHSQRHIFGMPFYYIDYTLALTCALQFWDQAARDRSTAMESYVKLCRRGGEAPFGELVRSAGLVSPFADGCLEAVVERAKSYLGLAT